MNFIKINSNTLINTSNIFYVNLEKNNMVIMSDGGEKINISFHDEGDAKKSFEEIEKSFGAI